MGYGELEPEHINHASAFEHLDQTLDNSIHGLIAAFNKDPTPRKLNLAVGVYRTEEGKPLVLNVVRRAEERLITDRQFKEYLPITGLQNFNKAAAKLLLGSDSPAILEKRVVTAQCLSGSGSLRVGGEFLAKHYNVKVVYLPQPTWENHYEIFLNSGLTIKTYRYYDTRTHGLDYQGMLQDIRDAQSGSVILLHACAHNPTGVDPTCEQWQGIRQLIRAKGHLPLFDCAYQGFASGSLYEDAYAIRSFAGDDGECFIAQSFSKNLGLYGERVGALSIVCRGEAAAICVESQLKLVIRPMYSSPPIHGASIASIILNDSDLFSEWTFELKAMADRVTDMRHQLYDALQARGTPGNWTHILKQVGMFSFSGLNKQQVEFMSRIYHIYMTLDGRISMAALRSSTIPHLADAIHAAVTQI